MPYRYSPEFRRKVLDLLAAGRSVASIASDLGVSTQTIYNWHRQEMIDTGQAPGLSSPEQAALRAARRRITELEAELAVTRRAHHPVHDLATPAPHGRPRWAQNQERPGLGRARRRSSPRCNRVVDHDPAQATSPLADLGPGCRDGSARPTARRHRPGYLFLRPAKPLAARHQREHQRPVAAVLPERNRPKQTHPRGS